MAFFQKNANRLVQTSDRGGEDGEFWEESFARIVFHGRSRPRS